MSRTSSSSRLAETNNRSSSKISTDRRHRLAEDVEYSGIEMAPCTGCRNALVKPGEERPKCVVSPVSGKCSECHRKNRKSCDVSLTSVQWIKLRDGREKLEKEIEELEVEEIGILQRMSQDQKQLVDRRMKKVRLRKQLRLAARRTETAVAEELDRLEAEDPPVDEVEEEPLDVGVEVPEHPFAFHGILEMPVGDWSVFDNIDFSELDVGSMLVPVSGG
ncbi:hypothetical protein B0A48_18714 [Cryoendolithus antarcticus]|uniref:Uncharacterized protein n=1 Tax=Cryoendolithus antarcticus TaxID=1507870 RepID=A0A1V8S7V0_9PEZI|nr:hypothetical protein B0A48_18903 [Cryoendolithus antarcticus]OQN95216.1 hypothetical protein B0A48_18714 [Cryoendolithus antarcticus]